MAKYKVRTDDGETITITAERAIQKGMKTLFLGPEKDGQPEIIAQIGNANTFIKVEE